MLIVLSKSPFINGFSSILDMALKAIQKGEKVGVLHIRDACIALSSDKYVSLLLDGGLKIYALKKDCEVLGLKQINEETKLIDCREWVELVMDEYNRVVSWT